MAALMSSALVSRQFSQRAGASNGTISKVSCMKKDIHPKFYPEAKVFCNGEEVLVTGGTKPEYIVDVWAGNHPFYQAGDDLPLSTQKKLNRDIGQGSGSSKIKEDTRVADFNKRFGELNDVLGTIPNLPAGKVAMEEVKKKAPVKGGKKGR